MDLSAPLAPEVVAAIRDAWTTHHVIFFRDQSLTAEQQADFARQFGTVTEAHPVLPSIEESPEVLAIDGKVDRASWWHTDVTFLQTPAMGSILYMLEAPEVGGDTMWASLQDAYDGLAEPVRAMCDKLIAIHHDPWFAADVAERGGYEWDGVWQEKLLPALHPVVRTHPENGRNGLFVNRQFTRQLFGLSDNESNAILEMLYHHCIKPEYTCRFRWRAGSVAFWDNRATLALRPRRLRRRRPLRPPGDPAGRQALRAGHAAARLLTPRAWRPSAGIAAVAFVGTNIDNALVTAALVAGSPPERARRIAAGQVVGFSAVVALAAAAAAVLFEFSPKVVGLLGLVPLALGLRGLLAPAAPRRPVTRPGDRPGRGAQLHGRRCSSPSRPAATTWPPTSPSSGRAASPASPSSLLVFAAGRGRGHHVVLRSGTPPAGPRPHGPARRGRRARAAVRHRGAGALRGGHPVVSLARFGRLPQRRCASGVAAETDQK